ncbi:MAG: ABC transporter substrate-binding protein [Vicinamibacterales bacterium]
MTLHRTDRRPGLRCDPPDRRPGLRGDLPDRRPGLRWAYRRPGLRCGLRRPGLLCLCLCLCLSLFAFAAGAQQAPHRIISLVPAATEMLFAMGAGPDVAGVSSYDTFPPEVQSRPKVGALVDPDFERMLTLRPDLVVVYGSQEDLVRRLERARIGVFNYRHAGLGDIVSTIRGLGTLVGRHDDAARLAASIERDLSAVRAAVAGAPRPRTALVFGREPGTLRGMYVSGGIGFLHDLLEVAGGTDVFGDIKREGLQVSTEMLLARAPDVVLELRASEGWDQTRLTRERAIWKQLPSLPAAKSDRIYILADSSFTIPGPRVAATARAIAAVLHPRR